MFDKKIILLISLLLITGSSYFIFHRKKNNDDEVIIDNSDDSINNNINEEESINEDVESSSSLLLFIIVVIVIIIIAAAIFFFIFYRRNKKKKEENPKEEVIIEEIEKRKKIFEEYKQFKEAEANKQKIADGTKAEAIKEILKSLINAARNELADLSKNGLLGNKDDYNLYNYIIDFAYPFANDKLKKPYRENNKIFYRFNHTESPNLFNKILSKFFTTFIERKLGTYQDIYEDYANDNFNSKQEKDKKEIMFLFIAIIIEPFFKAIKEKKFKNESDGENGKFDYIFISRKDNDPTFLKSLFSAMKNLLSNEKKETIKEISEFFDYAINSDDFSIIFNQLIGLYFPFDFVPEEKP